MHDWPDNEAARILQNVARAMGPDSRILTDEIVVPDIGAHWEATMQDLAMMNMCVGKERSEQERLDLADRRACVSRRFTLMSLLPIPPFLFLP